MTTTTTMLSGELLTFFRPKYVNNSPLNEKRQP